VLCPATSWQKSGAVILGEARIRALQINCIDPLRPEGHSGGQPLPSVVKIKIMNHREHRGSQELIGVVQPWEGMPFRRAVHLIWRTYGTAEAVPFHHCAERAVHATREFSGRTKTNAHPLVHDSCCHLLRGLAACHCLRQDQLFPFNSQAWQAYAE